MSYTLTIGLEIHAELKTKTKMFCNSANNPFNSEPNVHICPVCMAHPGTLPVINKEAVKHVLKVGLAVGGKLADFSEFDRKNYFYPDIPKGYQISQYKYPLVSGGSINGVLLERIHLEEDTATSIHEGSRGSLVDYNRAGVPLMELVTTPTIHSAEEASAFARELQLLLRTLGVSDANMEKGEMRVEANISISNKEGELGTKVEVKNLNSFRSVERAVAYEVERMTHILDTGEGEIVQETRGWDEIKEITFTQRKKESAHDYRYFPDPDLPKLQLSEIPELSKEALQKEMPELPWEKRARLVRDYSLKPISVDLFLGDLTLGKFFEDTVTLLKDKKLVLLAENYLTSDVVGLAKGGSSVGALTPVSFAKLIRMINEGKLSSRGAKDTLAVLYTNGGDAETVAKEKGFMQTNDESALKAICEKIIKDNPKVADEYRGGKVVAMQFLVGQGMKASKGSANPSTLKKLFEQLLK
ncbi:MAG: Asp-tRNA(Asn)/Glu-tRNA(Gln) amidotransferase subunit GatB [Candidatus Pacebacteria bacterium]|nr:Asp-tRNA(Asn)/Glu-tRNA(Gln) amidotransferase subunit GatB [Candidatus Paceibacterota bacterium]